jgi:lysozyme
MSVMSDLLNDDIRDDIKCAKEVFNRSGLKSWKGWELRCKSTSTTEKNKALPNLVNCAY